MLAKRIEIEAHGFAVRTADGLGGEIDGENSVGAVLGIAHQQIDLIGRQGYRQDPVLKAIIIENIGEARGDDAADTEIEQRPGARARGSTRNRNSHLSPIVWPRDRQAG